MQDGLQQGLWVFYYSLAFRVFMLLGVLLLWKVWWENLGKI